MSERTYTPSEAASEFNLIAKSLRGWLRCNKYHRYQQGRWWHVPESVVIEYIAGNK